MPNSSLLFKIFQFNLPKSMSDDARRKASILNLFGLVSLILYAVYGIIGLAVDNTIVALASFGGVLIVVVAFMLLRAGKVIASAYALSFAIFLVGVTQAYIGVADQYAVAISLLLPLITIYSFNIGRAVLINISYLLLFSLLLYVPMFDRVVEYSIVFKLSFITSFVTAFILFYVFDYFNNWAQTELEKQVLLERNINKRKDEFISTLSHQIRTPLNNIMVIANLVDSSTEDEKLKDLIDTIHASTNNLVNVVNSMVEVSNIDLSERDSFTINFNLGATVANTIKLFAHQYSNNVQFNLKIDEVIPGLIGGEPVKIKQVFLNIIESLIKTKSTSRIKIDILVKKSSETAEKVDLLFELRSNSPIFIPAGDGKNQLITSDLIGNAVGSQVLADVLDLKITQRLIEKNGGKLTIVLNSDSSIFSFPYTFNKVNDPTAPLKEVEEHQNNAEVKVAPTYVPLRKIDLLESNVLLVEDNLINQKIVILSLKKLVKNIEIANNGKEALDRFGTSRFDIILMDIQMPIMNGIVTTRKIREIEASTNTHTPIIAITANALQGDREECIAAGMDDYLSKPFQIEVLIQKMKRLLSGSN
jgi:FOG: CheY-like receiver